MSPKERAFIGANDEGPDRTVPLRNHRRFTLTAERPRRKILVNESAQRIRTPVPS